MRLAYITLTSLTALLTVSCSPSSISPQSDTTAVTSKPRATKTYQPGVFQTAEHTTRGNVKVITENGKKFIEFDKNFKTDSGPDLLVILHKDKTLPNSGIKERDYISVAPLTETSGTQRYTIPEKVDLQKFQSVAILCRQFNATFGYAPL